MTTKTRRYINFSILDRGKIHQIHAASIYLMEKIGMRIGGKRALKLLRDHGAAVSREGLVKISSSLVEKALKSAPKELTLYNRAGEPAMIIGKENNFYFGCHSDMLEIVDPCTGKTRDFMKRDIELMCKIADYLPNIHFVLSVGLVKDVPPEIQSRTSFLETVKNCSKTINFSTNDIESLQVVIDMAAIVAGGQDRLKQKPFIFNYCEPVPPLNHPEASTEKLYISAQNRIPVVYMPYCMMGGTAPQSFAGSLVQCNAEVLTGLVLTQLVSEGSPFIYGAMPSIMDMKSTIGSYGAIEFHLLVAAASEMADHYGLPFYGTAGCTDAKALDEQAVTEATFEIFSSILSKANLIHDIGVADHCNNVCPELVVLSDEIIETLKHYVQGIDVDSEEMVLGVVEKVGPGGAFLMEDHTLQNFKKIYYSDLFSRKMDNPDESEIRSKIRAKIKHIIENHQVPQLDDVVMKELDKLCAKLAAC
ncbi:MAG: trimethylamine methyltransferase family protein [Deltaproteobacteria bacterium]|nr:MAG: trimethylamine methyltransferase family protein [Deltaproteobacteria bacterium]